MVSPPFDVGIRTVAAWVWTASSLPSGLTSDDHTGSPNRSVRSTRAVRISQNVMRRLVPPATSVRPPGSSESALANAVARRQGPHQP